MNHKVGFVSIFEGIDVVHVLGHDDSICVVRSLLHDFYEPVNVVFPQIKFVFRRSRSIFEQLAFLILGVIDHKYFDINDSVCLHIPIECRVCGFLKIVFGENKLSIEVKIIFEI